MANLLSTGDEFNSYIEFENAFKQYCQSTRVNGERVKFIHSASKYITGDKIPKDTKERLRYERKAERCKHSGKSDCKASFKLSLHAKSPFNYVLRLDQFERNHGDHVLAAESSVVTSVPQQKPKITVDHKMESIVKKILDQTETLSKQQSDAIANILDNLLKRMEKNHTYRVDFIDYPSDAGELIR